MKQIKNLSETEILDLSDQNLVEIPFEIPENNVISILNLSKNRILKIPTNLHAITSCFLSFNQYKSIPDSIIETLLNYQKLINLDLSYNEIQAIQPLIFKSESLKRLNLFKNCLSSFSDVKNDNIKCLDIGFNNFENIPLSFENLTILNAEHNFISVIDTSYNIFTKLTRLILNSNNITAISDNICFPQLLIFDVSYNQLIELPNISIIMPKLKTLDASFNSLKKVPVLPQSLINLYLHHNHINDIKKFF